MTTNTPAGWYQADTDPEGTERFWDGSSWTAQQRQAGTPFSLGSQSGYSSQAVESNLAGIGNRIGARVLDWLVWLLLGVPGMIIALLFVDDSTQAQLDGARLPLNVSLIQFGLGLVQLAMVVGYESIMNTKFNNNFRQKSNQYQSG